MTALFDVDGEGQVSGVDRELADAACDVAFGVIRDHVGGLEPRAALRAINRYRSELAAMKTTVVAAVSVADGERAAKRMLNDGKTSKGEINRATKRAEAASANPELVGKVASGDLSEEHLDVIADAAGKTDGAAAVDPAFIDEIASTDPDQAKNIADRYVQDKQDPDGVQSEHDRQRAKRRAIKYQSRKNGTAVLSIEGDDVSVKAMWEAIAKRSNTIYQSDGARDLATGKHPRTNPQRDFDAAHELICDVTTKPNGSVKHQPRHGKADKDDKDGKPGKPRPISRPVIVVAMTIDKHLGLAPGEAAEQIGLGLIPDSVLADYLEHADIISALYDTNGQPFWMSRARRNASWIQRVALIIRDKACVQCGASHTRCDVHHRIPWSAPAKGATDLDNLVLLCGRCHRELHDNLQTLYQDAGGIWRTRPATPAEIPPAGRSKRNPPRRE